MNVVIDKDTNQVKRFGNVDFENDGQFDSETEEMLTTDFMFDESVHEREWFWNETTETFDKGDPVKRLDRYKIIRDILSSATPGEQQTRMFTAMNKYGAMFIAALDNNNIDLAKLQADIALSNGDIIQADHDILYSCIEG